MAEPRARLDRSTYFALLLFAGVAVTLWALGLILAPFAVPIAWALCLLTVTSGFYQRLAARSGRPGLSALLMTLGTAVMVVVPIVFVGIAVAKEAAAIFRRADVRAAEAPEAPRDVPGAEPAPAAEAPAGEVPQDRWDTFFTKHPKLAELRNKVDGWLGRFGTDTKKIADAAVQSLSGPFLAGGAMSVARDLFITGFGFIVMLATLYFLYRDGHRIRAVLIDVVPLEPKDTGRILDILKATTFAAIVGGLLTALIQGALGGIAFAVTGVSGAVLWGVVMALLSLLPFGGAAFVWFPVAVYLLVNGHAWQGWFLMAWGVLVIGLADNLFRPWIMRKAGAGDIHPLLLFFAIVSGIGVFGMSGIVFGPLLVAVVLGLVRIYREHFGKTPAIGRPALADVGRGALSPAEGPIPSPPSA